MKRTLLTAILLTALLHVSPAMHGVITSRPRLAIIITVDGLQGGCLSAFMPKFGTGGFRRIITGGAYNPNGKCAYIPSGKCSDYASLSAGTVPAYHGMVADRFFSTLDEEVISALDDARYESINSALTLSPKNLQTTTIADELKLADPRSRVYSIGLDPESAILMGGHLADCALWIDNGTALVATSKYYDAGLPDWAAKINTDNTVGLQMARFWSPDIDMSSYMFPARTVPSFTGARPIFYQMDATAPVEEQVRSLKRTPNVNAVIKALAIRALRDEALGSDDSPDLLCVEFNARHANEGYGLCAETEDMYLSLDRTIGELLDAIDISVGLDNVVIVLTGNHIEQSSPQRLASSRINSGTFNASRTMALLNSYLMALYGQGRWVSGYYARNIHLNRRLIEDSGIDFDEIQSAAARLMLEFTGVHTAYTESRIQYVSGSDNDMATKLRNGHFKNRSGDVVFTLMPGWFEVDSEGNNIGVTSRFQSNVPIAVMGYEIPAGRTSMWYEDIVPTLCRILEIPAPNGTTGDAVEF